MEENLLDELDLKILSIISQNARTPFKEVAEACGVSRAAIHQRVQKMFDNGTILGSGYQINPKRLGYNLCAYVGLTLDTGKAYYSVSKELEAIPEIVESVFTLGAFGILVKLYARDNEHLLHILNDQILEIPHVTNTETLAILDQRIARPLPIGK